MRCKVGDLVVVSGLHSKAFTENLGRFGTVVRAVTAEEQKAWPWLSHHWVVEPQNTFMGWCPVRHIILEEHWVTTFSDACLTPIRPGDLSDETETTKELEHS